MTASSEVWKVIGYDSFEAARDPKEAEYWLADCASEDTALMFAHTRLVALEEQQPTASSGGQGPGGIQDWVFIVCPDGARYRVLPPGMKFATPPG